MNAPPCTHPDRVDLTRYDLDNTELCLDCGAHITTHPDGTVTVEVRGA